MHRGFWFVLCLGACSDDDAMEEDTQLPPQGAQRIEAWLASGAYETWQCEPAVHAARAPSPHGFNRICSNDALSASARGQGAWPKGAAAVKELYTSLDATTPAGYSVYLKTADDSADGASWYWYERLPPADAVRFGLPEVVADSLGDRGNAKSICVSCHREAPRDQVYTPVL